jgi:hypothetical protein
MAVALEIRDGPQYWWLSPDIWVVPGSDPAGSPGQPIAGEPAFLWARVHNTGDTAVSNATVRFYAANPAVGFDRSTATLVGTAFVTLTAGQSNDVLCLAPWVPTFINDGHICVLAEAFHPNLDPLPAAQAFDVPNDRHVAQRNLTVLKAIEGRGILSFEIHNPSREDLTFTIRATPGELRELELVRDTLGVDEKDLRPGEIQVIGFAASNCPTDADEEFRDGKARVNVRGGGRAGLSLLARVRSGAGLVHVVQSVNDREVGGLTLLLISREG